MSNFLHTKNTHHFFRTKCEHIIILCSFGLRFEVKAIYPLYVRRCATYVTWEQYNVGRRNGIFVLLLENTIWIYLMIWACSVGGCTAHLNLFDDLSLFRRWVHAAQPLLNWWFELHNFPFRPLGESSQTPATDGKPSTTPLRQDTSVAF